MDCKLLKVNLRDHSTIFHPFILPSSNYKSWYFPVRSLKYIGGILHRHIELLICDWLFECLRVSASLARLEGSSVWEESGQSCSLWYHSCLTQSWAHSTCSINEWVSRKGARSGAGRLKAHGGQCVDQRAAARAQWHVTIGKGDSWNWDVEFGLYSASGKTSMSISRRVAW